LKKIGKFKILENVENPEQRRRVENPEQRRRAVSPEQRRRVENPACPERPVVKAIFHNRRAEGLVPP